MAKFAKRLVVAQGLEGVVEVIQGVIESVDIPEKVDIIISEWMVRGGCGVGAGMGGRDEGGWGVGESGWRQGLW